MATFRMKDTSRRNDSGFIYKVNVKNENSSSYMTRQMNGYMMFCDCYTRKTMSIYDVVYSLETKAKKGVHEFLSDVAEDFEKEFEFIDPGDDVSLRYFKRLDLDKADYIESEKVKCQTWFQKITKQAPPVADLTWSLGGDSDG